jgi:ABC-type transport system involved in cytochrome c biogenesis permease subunit
MTINHLFGFYMLITALVSFIAMMKIPTKMGAVENIGGSILAAICFGWIIWPFTILAARKAKRLRQ